MRPPTQPYQVPLELVLRGWPYPVVFATELAFFVGGIGRQPVTGSPLATPCFLQAGGHVFKENDLVLRCPAVTFATKNLYLSSVL
ncbi:MAG: hypothetical protein ABSE46_09030 [Terracidiphilus sp.]